MRKLHYPSDWSEFYWENPSETPHIGHSNHLCDMAQQGEITLSEFKELVKDLKFICKKCGRAAAKEDNLCEPVSL